MLPHTQYLYINKKNVVFINNNLGLTYHFDEGDHFLPLEDVFQKFYT